MAVAKKKVEQTLKQKLAAARAIIAKTPMKKSGRNTYSKYDYFTPSQVHQLVESACQEVGIIAMFSLIKSDLGYRGILTVEDLVDDRSLEFSLVTDVPIIKATNEAQKLGGMATYTERYLKMSAFGIMDNNLDFDNGDNRPKKPVAKKAPPAALVAMTKPIADAMLKFIEEGKREQVVNQLGKYSDNDFKKAVHLKLADTR